MPELNMLNSVPNTETEVQSFNDISMRKFDTSGGVHVPGGGNNGEKNISDALRAGVNSDKNIMQEVSQVEVDLSSKETIWAKILRTREGLEDQLNHIKRVINELTLKFIEEGVEDVDHVRSLIGKLFKKSDLNNPEQLEQKVRHELRVA